MNYAIGRNLFQMLPALCKQWGHRSIAIVDENVIGQGQLIAEQCDAEIIPLPSGESSKSREMKHRLEDELLSRKCGKDTVILAIGGGVTTDLVGFVASTYLRGVPLILIPTTLLAIVDAAIGGKTGIDTPQGKNLIGSHYPAHAVVADLNLLATLPEREWLGGYAEILKAALIADPSLWTLSNDTWRSNLEEIVEKAVRIKMDVVEKDPLETGLRRILNFGHTVAHALEAASHYALPHGEAVAIGLLTESYLSYQLGFLAEPAFQETLSKIENSGFALQLPKTYTQRQFIDAMSFDKKNAKGATRFTLIDRIGSALPFDGHYCAPVPTSATLDMAHWMEKRYG